MTLFEFAEARAKAETITKESIDRVESSNARWVEATACLIRDLAAQGGEFTADEVWPLVEEPPTHPSAMGAAFRLAAARRWIVRAEGFRISLRPQTHLRPLRLWRVGVLESGHRPMTRANKATEGEKK